MGAPEEGREMWESAVEGYFCGGRGFVRRGWRRGDGAALEIARHLVDYMASPSFFPSYLHFKQTWQSFCPLLRPTLTLLLSQLPSSPALLHQLLSLLSLPFLPAAS